MYDPSDSFVPFFWECIASCHILLQNWKPQTGTTRCQNLQNASFEIPLPPKTEYRENMFLFATQVTQHPITAPGSQSKHHLYLHSFGQPDMSPDLKSISLKRYDFSSAIPAKDKQQMSHAHACLSIHPQKYGTPVFLRGFYEEQVKRRQTQWEMCWRKWSREPWIICVEGWESAMSYSIRVWPAHRESNLRVEAVRHIDDMSYKKGLRLCFTRTALCSCPDVHLEIWSSLRRFWDICIRKSLLR